MFSINWSAKSHELATSSLHTGMFESTLSFHSSMFHGSLLVKPLPIHEAQTTAGGLNSCWYLLDDHRTKEMFRTVYQHETTTL